MAFNFQKFTDTDTSFAARVTIRQTGQFGFNAGAINRFGINKYGFAVLYYDPEQRVVGIELTQDQCPGAIEIKSGESNTYLRSKNFCDRFGIDYREAHRFELKQDQESSFLYFELAQELAREQSEQNTAT